VIPIGLDLFGAVPSGDDDAINDSTAESDGAPEE